MQPNNIRSSITNFEESAQPGLTEITLEKAQEATNVLLAFLDGAIFTKGPIDDFTDQRDAVMRARQALLELESKRAMRLLHRSNLNQGTRTLSNTGNACFPESRLTVWLMSTATWNFWPVKFRTHPFRLPGPMSRQSKRLQRPGVPL